MEDNLNKQPDKPSILKPEISQGLYNLTGWEGTFFNYWKSAIGSSGHYVLSWYSNIETREVKDRIPAYDLEYLLAKLPRSIEADGTEYFLEMTPGVNGDSWVLRYQDIDDGQYHAEDAPTLTECAGLMAGFLVTANIIPGKAA